MGVVWVEPKTTCLMYAGENTADVGVVSVSKIIRFVLCMCMFVRVCDSAFTYPM